MTELLLVTGSRDINETGIAYARKAVARAAALGYEVIVGDAESVDEAVMQECHRLDVTCTVVGAYGRLRRRTPSCKVVCGRGSYIKRDRYMAEQCDMCLAIWNGESRGTKATHNFAVALGKTAWLRTFHSEDSRGERPANEGVSEMTNVTMYTDGACSGNPGPAGWAAILQCGQHEKEVVGGAEESTNNRAEIMAVIAGLEALKFPCSVTIYTDSQYVIGVASKGWKRKANCGLLAQMDRLLAGRSVTFVKVKAHNGNPMNERCDQLAKAEVERQRSIAQGGAMTFQDCLDLERDSGLARPGYGPVVEDEGISFEEAEYDREMEWERWEERTPLCIEHSWRQKARDGEMTYEEAIMTESELGLYD